MPSETDVRDAAEPLEAYEDEECLLCAPAPHENCEMYTVIQLVDPADVPLGEEHGDHLVSVPVCLAHHEAVKKYQRADRVSEVTV